MGLVARKTWQRLRLAGRSDSVTRSMSSRLARARAHTIGPSICRAPAPTASESPGEAAGKPASSTSTPSAWSARATWSLCVRSIAAPGACSPSRRLVSKTMTRRSLPFSCLSVAAAFGGAALFGPCGVMASIQAAIPAWTLTSFTSAPRPIASGPVRTISAIPYGRTTSTKASTLSGAPVISTVSVSGETSTTRARKRPHRRSTSARLSGGTRALTSANSRATAAAPVRSCTWSTSTSFSRFACTRQAVSASEFTTSVIRETPGRSVVPTVSEEMLNPRRRNSDTTRFNAPGRSSTVATNVWATALFIMSSRLRVGTRFEHRGGAADHVAPVRVDRDHRVDAVFLLDAEIDHGRARGFLRPRDRALDLLAGGDAQAEKPVGLGQLDEVGADQRRGHVAAAVEELLPLPDHPQVAVVDDGHVELQALLGAGGQLAGGHLEAAVAGHHPDLVVGAGEARADRRRQREAHGAQAARGDERARALVLVVLRFPHLVLADVGDHQRAARGEPPQIVQHVRGEQPAGAHPPEQLVQGPRRVAHERDVDLYVLVDFRGIDLHVNLAGVHRVRAQLPGDPVVEPHPQRDEQVGFLDGLVHPGLAVHAHHPQAERVRGREASQAQERARHRDAGLFRELDQRPGGVHAPG